MSSLPRLFALACVVVTVAQAQVAGDLVLIPEGTFVQGNSIVGEGSADELPARNVTVAAFAIGRAEVTWQHWQTVRDWATAHGYSDLAGKGYGRGDQHPVISISWHDAVKWCNARSELEGLQPVYYTSAARTDVYRTGVIDLTEAHLDATANGYRLPTEAEWERAARGGVEGRRFAWGDSIDHTRANYFSSSADAFDLNSQRDRAQPTYSAAGWPFTAPVSAFAANAFGLSGIAGNAAEWCWDRYSATYYSNGPSLAPRGPSTGTHRVLRGGSWNAPGTTARLSHRGADRPASPLHGFRVAQNVSATTGAPVIVQHPADVNALAGDTVVLTVVASGDGPFLYAWTRDGTAVPDAHAAQLVIASADKNDSGLYRVEITNGAGSALSDGAIVSIGGYQTYAGWALGRGLLSPDAAADPDGDGLNNLLEFALGLDPEQPDTQPLVLWFGTDGEGSATYAFAEVPESVSALDVTVDVQMTNSLTNWDALSGSMMFVLEKSQPTGKWTRTFRSVQPCGPNDLPRFFRVRVTR